MKALAEQVINSGSSFIFLVLLSRAIGLNAFTTYNVSWSVIMLAEGIVSSVFGDTGTALINRLSGEEKGQFRSASLLSSMAATALISLTAVGYFVLFHSNEALIVIISAIATICYRSQQAFRRMCYMDGQRGLALFGAIICSLTLILALGLLNRFARPTALLGMAAFACGCGASIPVFFLKRRDFRLPSAKIIAWTWKHSWLSGRWLLAATFCYWVSTLGLIPISALLIKGQSGSALRILQLFTSPLAQVGVVLSTLIMPATAKQLVNGTRSSFIRASWPLIVFFSVIAFVYAVTLTLLGRTLIGAFFHNSLPALTVAVIGFGAVAAALDMIESAVTMPQIMSNSTFGFFVARLASVLALLGSFYFFGSKFGLLGLLAAMAFGNLTQVIVAALSLAYLIHSAPSDIVLESR